MPLAPVGILAVGVYLPEQIRKNDWWTPENIANWKGKGKPGARMTQPRAEGESGGTSGVEVALKKLSEYGDDPFRGTVERRIMSPDMNAIDMYERAAKDAIERSGVAPSEIDLVLGFTLCPDNLNSSEACRLHERLGLREECLAMEANAVCNSFQAQLAVATAMVRTGEAKNVLCVQCCAISRMVSADEPSSAWSADGCTAVVVGAVSGSRGLLAQSHYTDGTIWAGLLSGVPGKRWWDEGRSVIFSGDRDALRRMVVTIPDRSKLAVERALSKAGLAKKDVDFYVSHQSTAWMQATTKEFVGLGHARSVDVFAWAGSLSATNIPLSLAVAEREGQLHPGDVVAMYAPGTGMTWSASICRWGR